MLATYTYKAGERELLVKLHGDEAAMNAAMADGRVTLSGIIAYAAETAKASVKRGGKPKTVCPLTREQFHAHATPLKVLCGDLLGSNELSGTPKDFRADKDGNSSFGWNVTGKVKVRVGDTLVLVQVTGNAVVVGSKRTASGEPVDDATETETETETAQA